MSSVRQFRSVFTAWIAVVVVIVQGLVGAGTTRAQSDVDAEPRSYEATYSSLATHKTPAWYRDAKLGIFIHWGVYSVPAWAPRGEYAEWYPNRYEERGTPTYEHHVETYGWEVDYEDFVSKFEAEEWDPARWARLFERAGARYVIPVAEHHDGFPMWDSRYTDWDAVDRGPKRDIIGDLGAAVRARDMRFGVSYHAMLNYYTPYFSGPHPDYLNEDYVEYMNAKGRELIDEYQPSILWLDGDWMGTPEQFQSKELIAYYYNQAVEWGRVVAVNDRWGKSRGKRGDFYTQEYEYNEIDQLIGHKWEYTRGLGHSFGYNANEELEDYVSRDGLVDIFVDKVAKGANVLVNVGPKANGRIPDVQRDLLLGLGGWLNVHGDGIYGTRPWVTPSARTAGDSLRVRFTRKGNTIYAFLLDAPSGSSVTIPRVEAEEGTEVRLLGRNESLEWTGAERGLRIEWPSDLPERPAHGVAITPVPWRLMKGVR